MTRPKPAVRFVLTSLLLAISSVCAAKKTEPAAEPTLSYNGQVSVSLAQELFEQKNYAEALKHAEKATRSDSKSGIPFMFKGLILDQLGDQKKAEIEFNKAIKLSPGNGIVRNAFGMHLCRRKEYSQADMNFLLASQGSNYQLTYQPLENAAHCALANNDLLVAEKRARSALSINPESTLALLTMVQIKTMQSSYFEARAYIQRLEALAPLDVSLLQLAYQIEKSAGDERAAKKYQDQLTIMQQAQIQPPTGEGQKKP